jgi:hypothetical protein
MTHCKDIHKEMFPFYGGKCLLCKAVQKWVDKFSQGCSEVTDDVMPNQVCKWLRQQSKDFCAVGFDTW